MRVVANFRSVVAAPKRWFGRYVGRSRHCDGYSDRNGARFHSGVLARQWRRVRRLVYCRRCRWCVKSRFSYGTLQAAPKRPKSPRSHSASWTAASAGYQQELERMRIRRGGGFNRWWKGHQFLFHLNMRYLHSHTFHVVKISVKLNRVKNKGTSMLAEVLLLNERNVLPRFGLFGSFWRCKRGWAAEEIPDSISPPIDCWLSNPEEPPSIYTTQLNVWNSVPKLLL